MTIANTRMMLIFNEWNRQYAEEPEKFSDSLDEDGQPIDDYGHECTMHFVRLAKEMDSKGLLPTYK